MYSQRGRWEQEENGAMQEVRMQGYVFPTRTLGTRGTNAKIIDELLAQTVLRKEPFAEVVPLGRVVEQQC